MIDYINKNMICDTAFADGGIYFYEDYFTFQARNGNPKYSLKIYYRDIDDLSIISGIKKHVIVRMKNSSVQYHFYIYKAATMCQFIQAGMEHVRNANNRSNTLSKEDLDKLVKLNELHKDGVISDEQFEKEKNAILNQVN